MSQRVLIVDDDPAMLHAVSRILRREHEVATAESGAAALRRSAEFRPALAIVDVHMPGMNGFELTRELKQQDAEIDVIVMTGNAAEPDEFMLRAIDEGAFYFIEKPFDRRVLLALVGRCLELRRLRLAERLYVQRLENELDEARQFQLSLLPPSQQQMLGVSINARYLACTALAGDIYDYAQSDDDSVAVLVADVVGHGTSAAMMTSLVKSAFHAAAVDNFAPTAVVAQVQSSLRAFEASRFVTLVCARLNTQSGQLTYVNAGHPPPLVRRRDGSPLLLESTGPLLSSAFDSIVFRERTTEFAPEDSLLLYTDGVIETPGESGLFGLPRMISLYTESVNRGAALLDEILTEITEFSRSRAQRDDVTLLSLDFA